MLDKDLVYLARLHWILFLGPCLLALSAIYVFNILPLQLRNVSSIIFIAAIIWAIGNYLRYISITFAIKKKLVIFSKGILIKESTDIPFAKIATVDIRQSILGSALNYGTLMIVDTGGARHFMNLLAKPLTCRRYIEQLLHENNM